MNNPIYQQFHQTSKKRGVSVQLLTASVLGGVVLGRLSAPQQNIMKGDEYIMITYPGLIKFTDQTIENKALDLINASKDEIYMNGFGFTSRPIANALINASKRGVKIYLLLDKSNEHAPYSIVHQLQEYIDNNKPSDFFIYIRDIHGIHHAKVLVADNASILGSYNWSKSANTINDEIVSVKLDDIERVKELKKAWYKWKEQKSYLFKSTHEEKKGQPWTAKHDGGQKAHKSSVVSSSPLANIALDAFNNSIKNMPENTEKSANRNIRVDIKANVGESISDKIRKSKTYCYLQIQETSYDTALALAELKKHDVEIILYTAGISNYAKSLLKNAAIEYHINSTLNDYTTTIICMNDTIDSEMLYIGDQNIKYLYMMDHNNNTSSVSSQRGNKFQTKTFKGTIHNPVATAMSATRDTMRKYRATTTSKL